MVKAVKQVSVKAKAITGKKTTKTIVKNTKKPLKASNANIKKTKDLITAKLKTPNKIKTTKSVEIKEQTLSDLQLLEPDLEIKSTIKQVVGTNTTSSNTISFNDIKAKLNLRPVATIPNFLTRS